MLASRGEKMSSVQIPWKKKPNSLLPSYFSLYGGVLKGYFILDHRVFSIISPKDIVVLLKVVVISL